MDSSARAWIGRAFEHDADHGEVHQGCDVSRVAFEIAGQTLVAADPSEGPPDYPSIRRDRVTMAIAASDDVHCPTARSGDRLRHLRPPISRVGKDTLDDRKAAARRLQQLERPIAVLKISGQPAHAGQEAERIDKGVAFAALGLPTRIEALRVE